jgi:hypothetical protein
MRKIRLDKSFFHSLFAPAKAISGINHSIGFYNSTLLMMLFASRLMLAFLTKIFFQMPKRTL